MPAHISNARPLQLDTRRQVVVAAELKEVIDLVVGGEETLRLAS